VEYSWQGKMRLVFAGRALFLPLGHRRWKII
jgi:hypothetical protein